MTDSTPPPWVDDLFPFPTPPALQTLVDIAWQRAYERYVEDESYDDTLVATHYDFMFDLAATPRPLESWTGHPEFGEDHRQPSLPMFATPEFVPFGALGTGADVGWLVPAPELGRPDHPVALANGHDHGVTVIGADTHAGLEFMLSWTLRRWRERPEPEPPAGRAADRNLLDRLAAELGVRPDPDRVYAGSSWNGSRVSQDTGFAIAFDVPEGWRHERGEDGIGVLAPADAYADARPAAADRPQLEPELIGAEAWLDAGHPATALLALKDVFVNGPGCYFGDLKPLWARAYRDLGRPEYADRLDLMARYQSACSCDDPH